MIFALIVVLIAITFGYVFAKLDMLSKITKMLKDEVQQLRTEINQDKNK